MNDTTQAADTKVDTTAKPAVETQVAQEDDLESLLSQFETATTKPATTQPAQTTQTSQPDPTSKIAALEQQVAALTQKDALAAYKADISQVIKDVKGDHDVQDWAVRGWIDAQAESDPRIAKVWENRHENPAAAKKLVSTLSRKFAAEQAKRPDPALTEDRLALTAAVKGGATSTKAPDEPAKNYGNLNARDFAAELDKELSKAKR